MKHRRLAGCVPCRLIKDSNIPELLLITSRRHPARLVFPKGGVKKGETPQEAALRETWEEAGVVGDLLTLLSSPHPDYSDDEVFTCEEGVSGEGGRRACRWYLMRVCEVAEEWPEMGERKRHWMRMEEAEKLKPDIITEDMVDLIKRAKEYLENGNGQ